jgi:hypothetical protein
MYGYRSMRRLDAVTIFNRRLFAMKLAALCAGTIVFVPLVYAKWRLPVYVYAGGLLGLHIYFLYLYAMRTPWRVLTRSKRAFAIRMTAVVFFIYLLSLIHFGGTALQIIGKLAAAFMIHVAILLGLMLIAVKPREQGGINSKAAAQTTPHMVE